MTLGRLLIFLTMAASAPQTHSLPDNWKNWQYSRFLEADETTELGFTALEETADSTAAQVIVSIENIGRGARPQAQSVSIRSACRCGALRRTGSVCPGS